MGFDRRVGHTLGRQLGIVGFFCKANDIPPLNCVVVNQLTGMPGDDLVVRFRRTPKEEQRAVMRFDWFSVRVPTTGTFRRVWESVRRKNWTD